MTVELVHQFLEESARRFAGKTALVHGEVRATYAEIDDAADRVAGWCRREGVAAGDRVILLLENGLPYVIAYYGILKAGAVAVPLSADLKPDGIRPVLASVAPRLAIASRKCERALLAADPAAHGVPACILVDGRQDWSGQALRIAPWREVLAAAPPDRGDVAVDPSDLCSIIFTSGSTGRPKGVMLTHRNIASNTASICAYLRLSSADTQMVILPFHYVMGKSLLNTHVAAGGSVVINNTFAYPATVLQEMAREGVTGFSGVPSTYAFLLHRSPLREYRDRLPALRYCAQAGGHMALHAKQQLREALPPHTDIVVMYGATEAAARLTYLDPRRFTDKCDSIGQAIPGVTLRVMDPQGNELPPGEIGELVASGDNIMQGYWRDPEATARALDPHGYHTGDQAYQDTEGFFFITGRADRLLKVGGHRINPQEVEDALLATDLVVEVAVLGLPDPLQGHRLAAVAVARSKDTSPDQILHACALLLPKHKLPAEIVLARTLPKSSAGKIDVAACRALMDTAH